MVWSSSPLKWLSSGCGEIGSFEEEAEVFGFVWMDGGESLRKRSKDKGTDSIREYRAESKNLHGRDRLVHLVDYGSDHPMVVINITDTGSNPNARHYPLIFSPASRTLRKTINVILLK